MRRIHPGVALLCSALLGAQSGLAASSGGDADAIAANEPVTFSVTGDVPYGSGEVSEFQQQIDEHDLYSPSELFFHCGDILSGSESCSETRYRTVANILKSSVVPAYIVPGDNETIDCSSPSTGWTYWTRWLLGLESNWSCAPSTSRQSGRTENFAFVHKGMLFVGINLVGGDNSTSIMNDDANWVTQQLQQNVANVRGAVIVAQAGPGGNRSTFFNPFVTAAKNFAKPILYIHGDGHSWKKDNPFSASNVTRVQVEMGGQELPVQVTATLSSGNSMFQFLRNPWDSNSPVVSRPPCGGGTTTPTLAITDQSVTEGNSGTVNATFTVSVTNLGSASVSVQYATAPGSAQAGQDYNSTSGTLSFSGSTTSRTVTVTVIGDTADEPDETFFVNLSNASGASIADGQGLGTIRDDDDGGPTNTLVFTPVADDYVQAGSTSNYGSATDMRVKTDTSVYRAYLKFQVSGLGSFVGARLRLFVTDATDQAGTMHPVSNTYQGTSTAWTESGLNGSNAPSITAAALAAVGSVSTGTWIEFAVTSAIGGNGTYSFALQSPSGDSGRYSSKEGSNPPQLVFDLSGSTPGNTPPVATDDSRSTTEDVALTVGAPGVLGNDNDADNDPLTAVVVTNPAHGTLVLQTNGGFTYTPQANWSGGDGFTYQARDGRGGTDNADVALTVSAAPDAPVAGTDTYSVQSGGTLDVSAPGILGNDTDADGDALSAILGANVGFGSLTLSSNGSFTYTPIAGFSGSDQFTYRASDGGLQSGLTTVTINVGGGTSTGSVTFMDLQTGGSTALATVGTTGNVSGASGDLFLAAIATKPNRAVNSVSGLGLTWSRVAAQCGGRAQTSIEVWMARGTPNTGTVSAVLAAAVDNAAIAVARYAGTHSTTPLGNVVSANTNGVGGTCSNGVDTPSYSVPVSTQIGSTLFGAVSMRGRIHTPGAGWTERLDFRQGTGGGTAGVAISERVATATAHTYDGSFESTVDWSAIAVELRPASPTKIAATPQPDTEASRTRLEHIVPNPAGQAATLYYELANDAPVEIAVFNARGQRLRLLTQAVEPAGRHEANWDLHDTTGRRVPAGVYFLRGKIGPRTLQQKLVVQR